MNKINTNILVVDDTPENLKLLVGMLKDYNYKVRPVPSGKLALNAAELSPPDLILLDINMPEMNGYEVCERLKKNEKIKDIPVIFLSALNETIDKVKAFSVGGVDYITKPFQIEEVIARVNTHLNLRKLQTELKDINANLEQIVKKRTEEVLKLNAEKEQVQAELKVAAQIQLSMLPTLFPAFPNRSEFDIYASMVPAKDVGGDFYDFFFVDDETLFFNIGDVSGKGVPAALFMAMVKTLLKDKAFQNLPPDEILYQINSSLEPENDSCMFATIFCGFLNVKTGIVTYSCGGHNPPLIKRKQQHYEYLLLPESFVVGAYPVDRSYFKKNELNLRTDDIIFLYSDGVTEAINKNSEFYSEERLHIELNKTTSYDPKEIITTISNSVKTFAGAEPQSDDITMLTIKF